ncbi:MAG: hypothetical protein PGN16_19235 [Sphingomonas phyllosphaerae]|uniref:hypothetical protein n=1 Tax=Sphingomonas phyllosphaerae TaxID=257003 RepID=UPI002FF7F733
MSVFNMATFASRYRRWLHNRCRGQRLRHAERISIRRPASPLRRVEAMAPEHHRDRQVLPSLAAPSNAASLSKRRKYIVQAKERERQEQLSNMGRALRSSLRVPTDTYITGDIPTLLTLLAQVPAVPERERR